MLKPWRGGECQAQTKRWGGIGAEGGEATESRGLLCQGGRCCPVGKSRPLGGSEQEPRARMDVQVQKITSGSKENRWETRSKRQAPPWDGTQARIRFIVISDKLPIEG